jgi:hypothetical protein
MSASRVKVNTCRDKRRPDYLHERVGANRRLKHSGKPRSYTTVHKGVDSLELRSPYNEKPANYDKIGHLDDQRF